MKIAGLITITVLAGSGAQAGEIEKSARETVTVCMQTGVNQQLHLAQAMASKVFAEVGVRLDWIRDERSCAPRNIFISLASGEQEKAHPGALAFALPYEGTHIQVFWDRIRRTPDARRAASVLGYVLAHEITHILQGFGRHSESGIMKAKWSLKDLDYMACGQLVFTEEDAELIHSGLASRSPQTAATLRAR